MKIAIPIISFFVAFSLLVVGLFICWADFGYFLLIVSVPIFTASYLILTILIQSVLLLLSKPVKKNAYRFFYYFCLAASIGLVFVYFMFVFYISSMNELINSIPDFGLVEIPEERNPYLDFHLLFIVPLLIQVFLFMLRNRRIKQQITFT